VANDSERGLLGIALSPTFSSDNLVYLSYTRSITDGGAAFDNRVERYRWNGSKLIFDRRVLTMPASPGPNHNGGKIVFGPDGKLYATIGDLNRNNSNANFERAKQIDRSGAILRINPSGTAVTSNPFYDARFIGTANEAINDVFAYGVRNSFGIAFDPRSGFLWDTENGPDRHGRRSTASAAGSTAAGSGSWVRRRATAARPASSSRSARQRTTKTRN
jgi:glucose/arabinose dehydrogenase